MQERRATPRQRVFKAGSIEFDGASVDCTIRNLSLNGAALDIENRAGIPHQIVLNMVTHQTRQHAYIVWRRQQRVGIMFARENTCRALLRQSAAGQQNAI
jgi:PilZ domain